MHQQRLFDEHDDLEILLELKEFSVEQQQKRILLYMAKKLQQILQVEQSNNGFLSQIEINTHPPTLTSIKIQFQGATMATPVAGPVTLTSAGQTVTASVLGFDQFGNPFTGTIPTPAFSSSDTAGAVITFDPATGIVTAVANGTAGITATVTTDAGAVLTDTETVTVAIPVVAPVLTSVKVAFA